MNDEQDKQGFIRRHRVAIILTVATVVSAVVLGRVLAQHKLELSIELEKVNVPLPKVHATATAIRDVTTGVEYPSIMEGSRQTNLNPGNISHVLHGDRSHTGGHIFELAA